MGRPPQNVLQYEFFVGDSRGGTSSLNEVCAECFEYTAHSTSMTPPAGDTTGPRSKMVVRVYDMKGHVTRWTKQVKDLGQQREVHFNAPRNNPITNWYARWQVSRLSRRIDGIKESVLSYFITYILSINGERNVARETSDYAFRPVTCQEEYDELLRAAVTTKDFWLYVFQPNDLRNDRNQVIVSMSGEKQHV